MTLLLRCLQEVRVHGRNHEPMITESRTQAQQHDAWTPLFDQSSSFSTEAITNNGDAEFAAHCSNLRSMATKY